MTTTDTDVLEPQPVTDFLAHRLVAARRRLGMNQAELARLLNVDQSTVSRLERGAMQGPPWTLVLRACLYLGIEPHALMVDEVEPFRRHMADPRPQYTTCRPMSILRARIALHFLYLGTKDGRLPEVLHHCLSEMMRLRPTVLGVSVLLFEWPRGDGDRPTEILQCHAQWRHSILSFAQRLEPQELSPSVRRLKSCWEQGRSLVRQERDEVPGWQPPRAVDVPMPHGMLGVDFGAEEDQEGEGTLPWATLLAETFDVGLRHVRSGREGNSGEALRQIAARLSAIEERVSGATEEMTLTRAASGRGAL